MLIQGDDAGGYILQDGFQVAPPLLRNLGAVLKGLMGAGQLPVGSQDFRCHGIEGVDQHAHLVIGFLFDNERSVEPLGTYVVSVDSIETLTGMDFFAPLPDELEDSIEAKADIRLWK